MRVFTAQERIASLELDKAELNEELQRIKDNQAKNIAALGAKLHEKGEVIARLREALSDANLAITQMSSADGLCSEYTMQVFALQDNVEKLLEDTK